MYNNPPEELSTRLIVPKGSQRFDEMIGNLIKEFNKKTTTYYCPNQHSVETRNSNKHPIHEKCTHITKGDIIGTEIFYYIQFIGSTKEETIQKFMKVCGKHADLKEGRILDLFFYSCKMTSEKIQKNNKAIKRSNPVSEAKSFEAGGYQEGEMFKRLKLNSQTESSIQGETLITYQKERYSEEQKIEKDKYDLNEERDSIINENTELKILVIKQNDYLNHLTNIVKDQFQQMKDQVSNIEGEIAQIFNTLGCFIRAESNKRKNQKSSKYKALSN